jgi:tetratricopeptide (TPR) repeat protein
MRKLALSMIVRNAESDLSDCLQSVTSIVDEIIVADTGSDDSSREIARQAGAKVISVPWENDFSKARNLSLAEVTCDWVLVLDADERLDPGAADRLPLLLANKHVAGYQVPIRNYLSSLAKKVWDRPAIPNHSTYAPAQSYPAYVDHENVRLFRHDPDIYFTGCVHETTGARILEAGRKLSTANFLIHHFGMVSDEKANPGKLLIYRDLGRQKVAEMPDDAQAHLELGIMELEKFGNVAEALRTLDRACALNPGFGVAWFFAGKAQFQLGQYVAALRSLKRAEAAGHSTPAVAELAGDTNYNLGNYDAACACYRRGLKRDPAGTPLESKLGLAEARSGDARSGLRRLRRLIEREPASPDSHDRLILMEAWLDHLPEAAEAAEAKLACVLPRPEDFLRAASIRARMQQWPRAAELLEQGLTAFPNSEPLRSNLFEVETLLSSSRHRIVENVSH